MFPILQEERVKKNRVRELWKQGKPAVQGWYSTGDPYHGAGPGISAQFVKMASKLCQIGNEMRMLTTATAEALKTFCDALS